MSGRRWMMARPFIATAQLTAGLYLLVCDFCERRRAMNDDDVLLAASELQYSRVAWDVVVVADQQQQQHQPFTATVNNITATAAGSYVRIVFVSSVKETAHCTAFLGTQCGAGAKTVVRQRPRVDMT